MNRRSLLKGLVAGAVTTCIPKLPETERADECWNCGEVLETKDAVCITYKGEVYDQACLECAILSGWSGMNYSNLESCDPGWQDKVSEEAIEIAIEND